MPWILMTKRNSGKQDDPEEIRNLKARRRYFKSLLRNSQHPHPQRQRRNAPKKSTPSSDSHLSIIPGYTILVFDTNILLSSLSLLSSLVESHRWTVVVPLCHYRTRWTCIPEWQPTSASRRSSGCPCLYLQPSQIARTKPQSSDVKGQLFGKFECSD